MSFAIGVDDKLPHDVSRISGVVVAIVPVFIAFLFFLSFLSSPLCRKSKHGGDGASN